MVRVGVALGATARAASTALRRQNVLKLPRQFGMGNLEVAFDALIPNSKFLLPTSRLLLLRLLFTTCRPVLLHTLGYRPARGGRHSLTPPTRRAPASTLQNAASDQIRKRPADRSFLVTQFLQTRFRAKPRQAVQLHSTQIGHKPSILDKRWPHRPTCWPVILTFTLISVKPAYMGTRGLRDLGAGRLKDLSETL